MHLGASFPLLCSKFSRGFFRKAGYRVANHLRGNSVDLLASKLQFTTQTNDPSFASDRPLRGAVSSGKTEE